MRTQLIFLILALCIGVGIGAIVKLEDTGIAGVNDDQSAPRAFAMDVDQSRPVNDAEQAVEIEELRKLLEAEILTRRALQQQVSDLSRQVASLQAPAAQNPGLQIEARSDLDANAAEPDSGWFDLQALTDSGMDSLQAAELKQFYEGMEMQRLQLRDQSIRENWDRDQYQAALGELQTREQTLKAQLGESGYDAYLYASGQPNRVAVTSVLGSAQAGQAGIVAGDHILSYDNQRIYSWFDLRAATAAGDLSDTVSVEVDRDGEILQFYLARGPLGIRMNSVSVAP